MTLKRPQKQGLYDPTYEHDSCGAGFVVNIKGVRSHQIVDDGLQVLLNLAHRGACGSEHNTGDGAGVLIQVPHKFLKKATQALGMTLPEPGQYGAGMIFLKELMRYLDQDTGAIARLNLKGRQVVALGEE